MQHQQGYYEVEDPNGDVYVVPGDGCYDEVNPSNGVRVDSENYVAENNIIGTRA